MSDDNVWADKELDPDAEPLGGDGEPGEAADPAADLEADLRKLQEERDLFYQQLARVQADFKNAQKRLEADKLQAIQYANTGLVKALLPTLDNFERAMEVEAGKTDVENLLKGMRIVYDQLVKALSQQAVEAIAPEPGTPFDPKMHEALMQQPSEQYEEPTVLQLLQKGYRMHDRVIRPAQVIVSKSE